MGNLVRRHSFGHYMMVDRQQKLPYAINTNDYNLRLLMWRKSLHLASQQIESIILVMELSMCSNWRMWKVPTVEQNPK